MVLPSIIIAVVAFGLGFLVDRFFAGKDKEDSKKQIEQLKEDMKERDKGQAEQMANILKRLPGWQSEHITMTKPFVPAEKRIEYEEIVGDSVQTLSDAILSGGTVFETGSRLKLDSSVKNGDSDDEGKTILV